MIEILLVVSIMVVIGAVVGPTMSQQAAGFRTDRTTSVIQAALRSAQVQAISQQVDVELDFDASTQKFYTKADLNGDLAFGQDEIIAYHMDNLQSVTVTMPGSTGVFNSMGRFAGGSDPTNWVIQVKNNGVTKASIWVYPNGYVKVD